MASKPKPDPRLAHRLRKLTPEQRHEWEERAAIMEHDGHMTREGAEWRALEIVEAGDG